jgi:hypothetical protein
MPYPCSGKNLITILLTDYIQKRRGQALLFSFEYNLLPNLISNFNHYMYRALVFRVLGIYNFGLKYSCVTEVLST